MSTGFDQRASVALDDLVESRFRALGVTVGLDQLPQWPSPLNGVPVGRGEVRVSDVDVAAQRAADVFAEWRSVPAPRRGQVIYRLGELLRAHKSDLADLVTVEAGKTGTEANGEVQEMIDVCDLAVGLSRQMHGLTLPSERPDHSLREVWHPLGPVGLITAFNFPAAVWAWNVTIALVCGDTVVWKPAEGTPAISIACDHLVRRALADTGNEPDVHQLLLGGAEAGRALAADERFPLVSATGSSEMGRSVAAVVASRFGRSLLELGGNNASIVAPSADLAAAVEAVAFAAVGTSGQRCTSLRRLFLHRSIAEGFIDQLVGVYRSLRVGWPFDPEVTVGPLFGPAAAAAFDECLAEVRAAGGTIHCGGERVESNGGIYVRPAIVEVDADFPRLPEETFAPVLYVLRYDELSEAIDGANSTRYGLSSSIFTRDLREAEVFTSAIGSDSGIANVNTSTSGAEIGAAFGGEKATGGGRESGSDAWKAYMRRSTQVTHYGTTAELAQGVSFQVH